MQIDFHHAVTYLCARAAGFRESQAEIVAYSAQYVDDATNSGQIKFDNDALYRRLSSAHSMLDYRNMQELKNHLVWIPFHFLPGNGGLPAGENPEGSFIEKLVCKPNSHVAQDMIADCIQNKAKPYSLHRLGITAHVLADTWGHQGFAGINHQVNEVHELRGARGEPDEDLKSRVIDFFKDMIQEEIPPLGHGQALSNPDLPYADWTYRNGLGKHTKRDNPTDFIIAANALCKMFQQFINGDSLSAVPGLSSNLKDKIHKCFLEFNIKNAEERHKLWLEAFAQDRFGLGATEVSYIPKGHGSWKHQAINTEKDTDSGKEVFVYSPEFLTSNWKMFHDAAKAHRLTIVNDILPKYGICAA